MPLNASIPMSGEVTSATTRERRVPSSTIDSLSWIPNVLTIDSFKDLVIILPHKRGRGM
jgi:hypothetical protein